MVKTSQDVNIHYIKIWKTVQAIPLGFVATYGQIADLAGLTGRARLVGKALSDLPTKGGNIEAVPWHRVINSQGRITFPVGSENFTQQKNLLVNEQVVVIGSKINLLEYQWAPDLAELLFKLEY